MSSLLAVDLGLRTGFAIYGGDGRLQRYWSRHYANRAALRRHVPAVLGECGELALVLVEGGGPLAVIWERATERHGVAMRQLPAETWRERLLLPRQQRNGREAKHHADRLARRVIEWSGAARPTSLQDDAAEAILVGLWGVLETGWLPTLPKDLG